MTGLYPTFRTEAVILVNFLADIPHGGRDFGEFFSDKTTHIAFPGAVADAGVRRSD